MAGRKKGTPKTGGRKKGSGNVITTTVRQTVLEVFQRLQNDPDANLEQWAKKETTEFYRMASKLIPTDIKADVKHTGKIILQIKRGQDNNY
jgi:hypothetical protein